MATDNTIIIADIRPSSPNRALALGLYCALEKSEITIPQFLIVGDHIKLFKEDEQLKKLNTITDISKVKNSTILLLREVKNFYEIDISNKVVYYAAGPLIDYFVSFIMPRLDVIIATNYAMAFRLIAICKQLNITVPVYRLSPFYDIDQLPINNSLTGKALVIGNDKIFDSLNRYEFKYDIVGNQKLTNGTEISKISNVNQYDYLIYSNSTNDNIVYEAMLSGVVVLAPDRLPFTEFIIDGINGYLYSTEEDINRILSSDNDRIISNLIAIRSGSDHQRWAEYLFNTINNIGAQDVRNTIGEAIVPMRRWIIPKMILNGDTETRVPGIYDTSAFRMIDEQDLEHILIFFSSQPFRDVYIFGWEFGNSNDVARTNRIGNLIRAFGNRAQNLYWCTDVQIEPNWQNTFNNMSVISTIEGLRRVRPL